MRLMSIVLVLTALPGLVAAQDHKAPVVRTAEGALRGARLASGVRRFRGIPYARPPVGALRWMPPAAIEPWTGVRDALEFGPSCPQPRSPVAPKRDLGTQSEDCLYLNVWAPPQAQGAPVMVWIHGGGMTIGSGAQSNYDGEELAKKGVVLVTINYRLGPFGFLAHRELSAASEGGVSGNQGLRDQIAALQWVQRNVAAFGGDPGCVTIFGESAGAVSIGCLLVSPPAEGLFHRAILQSGIPIGIKRQLRGTKASGEEQGRGIMGAAGAEDLAGLRGVTAEDLLRVTDPGVGPASRGGEKFGPIIDGEILPGQPLVLMAAGRFHHVPVLLGANADEATLFFPRAPVRTAAGFRRTLRRLYGPEAKLLQPLYPVETAQQAQDAWMELFGLHAFVAPTRLMARLLQQHESPVWLYHFQRSSPALELIGKGATHGAEISYVFGNGRIQLVTEADRALAAAMADYWTTFADQGRPAPEGRPAWQPYAPKTDRHLVLDDPIHMADHVHRAACKALETHLRRQLGL